MPVGLSLTWLKKRPMKVTMVMVQNSTLHMQTTLVMTQDVMVESVHHITLPPKRGNPGLDISSMDAK